MVTMASVPIQSRLSGASPVATVRDSAGATDATSAVVPRHPVPSGYAILFMDGAVEREGRNGLSHVEAMTEAEGLQRKGKTARIMHVLGAKSYEVDRYPPR
jgi:hypothetical protein